MIYTIDTVDLMKKYYKVDYDKLIKTNYIIIGSRVMITKNRKNVHNASNLFINTGMLRGVPFDIDQTSDEAYEQFKTYVIKNISSLKFLSDVVEALILDGENALFICSPNEMKTGYMKAISKLFFDLFGIPVCRYPNEEPFDLADTIKRLLGIKELVDRKLLFRIPEDDMIKQIKNMDKKKLKEELKYFDIYEGQDSRKEMRDDLIEFCKEIRKNQNR